MYLLNTEMWLKLNFLLYLIFINFDLKIDAHSILLKNLRMFGKAWVCNSMVSIINFIEFNTDQAFLNWEALSV